jgi:hypothetical protein
MKIEQLFMKADEWVGMGIAFLGCDASMGHFGIPAFNIPILADLVTIMANDVRV